MMRHLRHIMKIKWYDKIKNVEILRQANLLNMANILVAKNLSWIGHIHRMKNNSVKV